MSYVARFGRDNGLYCMNLGFSGQGRMQEEFARYLADCDTDAFIFDTFPTRILNKFANGSMLSLISSEVLIRIHR